MSFNKADDPNTDDMGGPGEDHAGRNVSKDGGKSPSDIAVPIVPPSRYLVFFALALGGCLLDLFTKHWIFAWLGMPGEQTKWFIDGVFAFQTSLNEGALFGMGQGGVKWFALFSIAAFFCIIYWLFVHKAARDLLLTVALGCVTAGIFGNLYDRLGLHGLKWNYANELHNIGEPVHAVRDWILVMIGDWPWPNFNIADSLLVVGVGILLIHSFFFDAERKSGEAAREV